jgi:ribosomal protein L37AE/L43A
VYCPLNPEHIVCKCGRQRRFFFNRQGFRIWRCLNCEWDDISAYLRLEYGPKTSIQFLKNTKGVK